MEIMPLSLHIHDNLGKEKHFGKDSHLIPGFGNIDWKEFLDIFYEKGYKGELVMLFCWRYYHTLVKCAIISHLNIFKKDYLS